MSNHKPVATINSIADAISKGVAEGIQKMKVPEFIPTGALEPMIKAVGMFIWDIVNAQCANKLGKTTMVVNILRNIFWEPDLEYFDYPAFHDWPYKNVDGEIIKHGRIICTAENAKEDGPIDTEIKKWWPEGRYTRIKDGKGYYSKYKTDTGWSFDILTFEQDVTAFEGPMMSWQWCDEPPKPKLMGAIMSRFSKQGVLMLSQTPINAGPFIDKLEDLKEVGSRIKKIEATIYDNSSESGIMNSKGTKRGLMTDEEIEIYKRKIPLDEHPARLEGKAIGKSGKIYPTFDLNVNVKHYDLTAESTKQWNGYCIMDPHDKYYPFIQWWAVLPPNEINKSRFVCYNEWPTVETLGGYYDQKRKTAVCNLGPEEISKIIKLFDGTHFGIEIKKRGIDPRFARNTESNYTKAVEGIVIDYLKYDIEFELPDLGLISIGRNAIRKDIKYDKTAPLSLYNEPDMVIMPHCKNTIRSLDRHYWENNDKGTEKEAEEFKDPSDCARMFKALEANVGWTPNRPPVKVADKKMIITENINEEFNKSIGEIGLG